MTVTPAKLAANRRNAKKSTGPRTAQGKARSSKNAVTHGIFCNDLVLQGEDEKLFESFRNTILIQLSPQNIVELMICDRIVTAQWKLRRLNTAEAITHQTNAQRTVMDHVRHSDEVAEAEDDNDGNDDDRDDPIDEFEAKQRESRLKIIMKMPWPMWIDELEQLMDENKEYVSPTAAISMSFLKDDGVMERLSRYEQRLELSIHRNLKRLEQMRKQSQGPKEYCPFVAPEAYRAGFGELDDEAADDAATDDAECENEAKEEDGEEEATTKSTKKEGDQERASVGETIDQSPRIAIRGDRDMKNAAAASDGLIHDGS